MFLNSIGDHVAMELCIGKVELWWVSFVPFDSHPKNQFEGLLIEHRTKTIFRNDKNPMKKFALQSDEQYV